MGNWILNCNFTTSNIKERKLNISKKTTKIIGVLTLLEVFCNIIGGSLYDYLLKSSDYINLFSVNSTQILAGVSMIYFGMAMLLIASIMLYNIFKNYSRNLALLFLSFRIVEFVLTMVRETNILSLITLSQGYSLGNSSILNIGSLILASYKGSIHMTYITFSIALYIFYYILLKFKLIPRFSSIWGLLGTSIVLILSVLYMYGYNTGPSSGYDFLYLIMPFNLLYIGFYLIRKGFSTQAIEHESISPKVRT